MNSCTVVIGQLGTVMTRGLCDLLHEEMAVRIIGAGLDTRQLEAAIVTHSPDVVVLDDVVLSNPSLIARLRAAHAGVGIVVIAHRPSHAQGVRLLSAGASACVSNDAPESDLVTAVRLAADGKHMLSTSSRSLTSDSSRRFELALLTPRECEVFDLLCLGYSNGEIALSLRIGVETVRTHVAHIYRKFGITTRRELAPASTDPH